MTPWPRIRQARAAFLASSLAIAACTGPPSTAPPSEQVLEPEPGWIMLMTGYPFQSDQPEGCVAELFRQQLGLTQAIQECMPAFLNPASLPRTGQPFSFLPVSDDSPSTGYTTGCGSGMDPTISSRPAGVVGTRDFGDASQRPLSDGQKARNQQLLDQWVADTKAEYEAASAAFDKARGTSVEAAGQRMWEAFAELVAAKAAQANPPTHTPPAGNSMTDPDAVDTCSAIAERVRECELRGWATPECKELLRQMRGCIGWFDPAPEGPDPCETPIATFPDGSNVMDVVLVQCYDEILPDPEQDPCVLLPAEGRLRHYAMGPGPAGSCSDPRALWPEDKCVPTMSFVEWDRLDLQGLIDEGVRRLGGPYFVLPKPPPPRPPGGPDPEPP